MRTQDERRNKNERNFSGNFFFSFFDQKLQFTYPKASIKDVQTVGEVFSPQKNTSITSKDEIFLGHFCPLGSGYGSRAPFDSGSGYGSGFTTLVLRNYRV
jgi:hypothetical protein